VILRETQRAVTPFGGIAVFITYLQKIGLVEHVRLHLPIQWRSSNLIEPADTWMAFLMTVLVAAKRLAHASLLRGDRRCMRSWHETFSHRTDCQPRQQSAQLQ
jgi:hypothetical protein